VDQTVATEVFTSEASISNRMFSNIGYLSLEVAGQDFFLLLLRGNVGGLAC